MRTALKLLVTLLAVLVSSSVLAEANRDSLVEAWEAHIRSLPGTARFEAVGDGVYLFDDTDLPYEGELMLVGALVRPAETAGYDTGFTHTGMVDFRLTDLSEERLSSQVYYYWLTDRQSLYFSEAEQRWVDTAAFQTAISTMYDGGGTYGALSFMLNYGIWIVLIGLLVFAFIAVGRQAKKATSLMDDSASINDKARENIDRAEKLQDEALTIARESRDLLLANNTLLRQMLDALKK